MVCVCEFVSSVCMCVLKCGWYILLFKWLKLVNSFLELCQYFGIPLLTLATSQEETVEELNSWSS